MNASRTGEFPLATAERSFAAASRLRVQTALERILQSEEFAGSPQLCRFLRHIVECRLDGEGQSLKESTIGLAVFNRGGGYDPKVDPIVRVEARRLRARLEAYYARDGADHEYRIVLPKGGYVPHFEPGPNLSAAGVPDVVPPAPARPFVKWQFGPALLMAACLLGLALWASHLSTTGGGDPVSRFWSSILDGEHPVMVIPADSALVLLQDLAHEPVSLSEYLTGEYSARLAARIPMSFPVALGVAQRRYTSIADLEFATRLSHRREAARLGILTRFARDVRVEDVKRNNLVLLGARHSNPWVELFEPNSTFRLEHDEQTSQFEVINTRPAPGESPQIDVSPSDLQKEIYGVITYHRNRDGGGKVLTVAGTSVAGTEAAADFLLDDGRLLPWLRRAFTHGEVRGFDILLHDRNLSGSAPLADVVAFHVDH
jgi:hypothetical protein